jgi:hypothetical protein
VWVPLIGRSWRWPSAGEVAALYTCSERAARQELDFANKS